MRPSSSRKNRVQSSRRNIFRLAVNQQNKIVKSKLGNTVTTQKTSDERL